MATIDEIKDKFKDLAKPTGADFSELIDIAFAGANLVDQVSQNSKDLTDLKAEVETASDNASEAKKLADNADTNVGNLQSKMSSLEANVTSATGSFSGKVNTVDLPTGKASNLADLTLLANFLKGVQVNGKNVATEDDVTSSVNTLNTEMLQNLQNVAYSSELPENTDLFTLFNQYNHPIYYYSSSNISAKTMKNCPVTTAFAIVTYPVNPPRNTNSSGVPEWSNTVINLYDFYTNAIYTTRLITNDSGNVTPGTWEQLGSNFAVAADKDSATTMAQASTSPIVVFY